MTKEIKEISKVDIKLLKKIEYILGSELNREEYDTFYRYFNEIRKPTILIDIKDDENIKDYITNLKQENEELKKQNNGLHNLIVQHIDEEDNLIDYKSRIDKAIEYIKESYIKSDTWEDLGFCNLVPRGKISYKPLSVKKIRKLLNILTGGDE